MAKLLTYEQKDTWMDRLCGVTKLIYFLAWSITSMLTYDTRVLAVMLVLSLILFKISKTEWKQVGSIFKFIMFFLVINVLAFVIDKPLLTIDTPAKVLTDETITAPAYLKQTSLYEMAVKCGIEDPSQFVQRFINYERAVR